MESLTYTLAAASDIPMLVDFRIAFLSELFGEQPEPAIRSLRESLNNYYNEAIPRRQYLCWLAKADGELAGIGGLAVRQHPGNFKNPSGKVGYILNMYTVPAFRRRGICTGILSRLIASAKEMGITAFELHASTDGEPVYRQQGFQLHPEPTYRKFIG